MKKRILAALLALGCALLVFTGCGSKKDTTPKNYTQIIHDAREAEDNDYYMIFSPAEDGKFTAQYGYSASYPADDLNDEIQNMLLPLLDLPEGSYTDLAASLSAMMVQSYGVASSSLLRARRRRSWTQWMPISRTSSRRWSTTSRISIRSLPPPRWPLSPPAKWSWCAVRTAMP